MKLATLTVTIRDFGEYPTTDACIDALVEAMEETLQLSLNAVAEKFGVVLKIQSD